MRRHAASSVTVSLQARIIRMPDEPAEALPARTVPRPRASPNSVMTPTPEH
jgi:hypothetical protein